MTQYFSKLIDRYLNHWIGLPTWDSMHPTDMKRFYQFLKALKKYGRGRAQLHVRDGIFRAIKKQYPDVSDSHLNEMANFFSTRAEIVLAYEEATLDPCVEMRDPYQVALSLRASHYIDENGNKQPIYSSTQIEKILAENFGPNWRDRRNAYKKERDSKA